MDELLRSIKEVQEGGKHLANWYLDHGYVLLDIQAGARARKFPDVNTGGRQFYVHRNPVYVLGRPEGVEPAEPPPNQRGGEKDEPNKPQEGVSKEASSVGS